MQCYENEIMLNYIYNILLYIDPKFERNNLLLVDILDQTGADNIVDLLKIEHKTIQIIAQPYLNTFHKAA